MCFYTTNVEIESSEIKKPKIFSKYMHISVHKKMGDQNLLSADKAIASLIMNRIP